MHKPESVLENEMQKILWNFCPSSRLFIENKRMQKDEQILGFCLKVIMKFTIILNII